MKGVLDDVTIDSQISFVPRRYITDNTFIAFEIIHSTKRVIKGKRYKFTIKIDVYVL